MLLAVTLAHASAASSSSSTNQQSSTGTSSHKTSHKSKKTHKAGKKGQKKIDSQRAREIQEALIREHYLDGQPSGVWNDTTEKAMERYQADNGWQSKTTPDARALIKLGLGPDQQHLLNPESAMTTQPPAQGLDPPNAGVTDQDKQQR